MLPNAYQLMPGWHKSFSLQQVKAFQKNKNNMTCPSSASVTPFLVH